MDVLLKPKTCIAWIPIGEEVLQPKMCIAWIPRGEEVLQPKICASILPAPKHRETVCVDTERQVAETAKIRADSQRQVCSTNRIAADTRRTLTSSAVDWASAKLLRRVAKSNIASAATRRCIGGIYVCIRCDTYRTLSPKYCISRGATEREVVTSETVRGDTKRTPGMGNRATARTQRRLGRGNVAKAALRRTVVAQVRVRFDTLIRVPHVLEYVKPPRGRRSKRSKRAVSQIADNFRANGIRSFAVTLGEMTLSDSFQMETVQPLAIGDAVRGRPLDYRFSFLVEETMQRDLLQTVKGAYSKDATLYSAIRIFVKEAQASYYAQSIAAALGLQLYWVCDDFTPSQNFEDSGMTHTKTSSPRSSAGRQSCRSGRSMCSSAKIRCISSNGAEKRPSSTSRIGRTVAQPWSVALCAPCGTAVMTRRRQAMPTTRKIPSLCRLRVRSLGKR